MFFRNRLRIVYSDWIILTKMVFLKDSICIFVKNPFYLSKNIPVLLLNFQKIGQYSEFHRISSFDQWPVIRVLIKIKPHILIF